MRARVFAVMALAALPLGAVAAPAEQGRGRGQQEQMRFRGMDRNGDGVITQSEWRGSAEAFRNHDWNRDGRLSGNEVRPGAARPDEQDDDYIARPDREYDDWTEEGFDYLDRNRDRRLTRAEWFYDRESFLRADRNRDNVLSRAEFLGEADDSPDPDRNERFEYLDRNNNNRIDRSEWEGSAQQFSQLDVNNDGVLTRAEVGGIVHSDNREDDLFAKIDHNGDGRLTQTEWHEDRASFERADQNRDNVITRAEFLAAETPDERFEHMDTNNNGRIERREWQGRADTFDTLDRNNDGVVTRAEMLGELDAAESQLFTNADQNRDNRLSESEWRWSRREFLQQDINRNGFVSREEFSTPTSSAVGTSGAADNRPLNTPVVINVNATERWTDTGIDLRMGDVLRIISTGSIRLSGSYNDSASAGGANRRADNAPMPNHPAGALIARISNGAPFFIGDGTNINTVTAAGRLYLSVNDDHLPDNSGMFRVTIVVRPR